MPAFLLQPIQNGPRDIHNRFVASDLESGLARGRSL